MDGASSGSHPDRPHSRHTADISAHRSKVRVLLLPVIHRQQRLTKFSEQRSHAQMSEAGLQDRTDMNHDTTSATQIQSSPRRSRLVLPPLSPSIRSPSRMDPASSTHPRRGFDYRRPTSTSAAFPRPDVVDLTADDEVNDDTSGAQEQDMGDSSSIFGSHLVHEFNRPRHQQRLPRFGRPIIDLSEGSSPPRNATSSSNSGESRRESRRALYREDRITPGAHQGDASEVLHERRRHRVGRPRPISYAEPPTPSPPRRPQPTQAEIDLTNSSDAIEDDVIFVSSRANPQPREPVRPAGRHVQGWSNSMEETMGMERILGDPDRMSILRRVFNSFHGLRRFHSNNLALVADLPSPGQFRQPDLNYNSPGFELRIDPDRTTPQTPAYQPPAPANDGFTRNPAKSEEVVCPSCGDELTQGLTEEKRQVWVVKSCGHVSNGSAVNRSLTNVSKGILWTVHRSSVQAKSQSHRQSKGAGCSFAFVAL